MANNPRLTRTVISNCSISEREFLDVFGSIQECCLAAFDEAILRASQLVKEAANCADGWHERVRAALSALLVFLDEEPALARLLLGDSPLDVGGGSERRQQALEVLTRALVAETQATDDDTGWFVPWPAFTAELVVGGVVAVLRKRMLEGTGDSFVELAPSLMSFIMGQHAIASANVGLEPTEAVKGDQHSRLQRLPVRVTYRTTRVLSAISDSPGLSNRAIAEAAGLTDEGQTSKLLRRLEQRKLVQNVGVGHVYGGANAWLLTAYGERVLVATRHSLVPGAGAVAGRRGRGAS